MTPYQRGSRDSLRAIADEVESIAAQYAVEAARCERVLNTSRSITQLNAAKRIGETAGWKRSVARDIAGLLRRRAEALPDDPEDEP